MKIRFGQVKEVNKFYHRRCYESEYKQTRGFSHTLLNFLTDLPYFAPSVQLQYETAQIQSICTLFLPSISVPVCSPHDHEMNVLI